MTENYSQSSESGNTTVKDSVQVYLLKARTEIYNDFSRALPLLENAYSLAEDSDDKSLLAQVNHDFAVAYYVKGDYDASLQFYLKSLELFRQEENQLGVAKCLIGQGLIQQGIDRHSEAIRFFQQAIKMYKEAGSDSYSSPAYLNIAISQIEIGDFDVAERNLETAMSLAYEAGRKDIEHLALNKLGEVAFLQGNLEASKSYFRQVLSHKEEPNKWEKSFAHAGLAEVLLKENKLEKALEHALKASEFSENVRSLWDQERNSRILANIYAAQGETDKAYTALSRNQRFKDSLYNQKKLREINLLQLESREADNERLQAKNEDVEKRLLRNRNLTILLIVAFAFLLILLLLVRKNARQKTKFARELEQKNETILEQNKLISLRNEELDKSNKAKNRLFSILSHDLRSPLASIQQLLELIQSGEFSQEEQKALLGEMLIQVNGTTTMLYNLLNWANSQLEGNKVNYEKILLPAKVEKVMSAYFLAAKHKNIRINHKVPPGKAEVWADRGHLSVVIHNLLSNAIKYTRNGKEIQISYKEDEERLYLKILDGGDGISEGKISEIMKFDNRMFSEVGTGMELGTGIGLMMVKQFLELNNGQLEIQSYPGTGAEFIISFPKASPENN